MQRKEKRKREKGAKYSGGSWQIIASPSHARSTLIISLGIRSCDPIRATFIKLRARKLFSPPALREREAKRKLQQTRAVFSR